MMTYAESTVDPPRAAAPPAAVRRAPSRPPLRMPRPVRHIPMLKLAAYYGVLVLFWSLMERALPAVRGALSLPVVFGAPLGGAAAELPREIVAVLAVFGAVVLVVPVAAVYMLTRRLRYDQSLVHSIIILPVVTAGILLVVENSLARAFSLAGIVAAVRFRNTLREPRDLVYVLLALGIGLAAGGQALDVALVMSVAFNLLILVLWGFNIGSIYAAGSARQGILSIGEPRLLLGVTPQGRGRLRREVQAQAQAQTDGLKPHGVVIVHTRTVADAQPLVEEVLFESARDWRLTKVMANRGGTQSLAYLVRLKRHTPPAELLSNLDECSVQVRAVEYLPLPRPAPTEDAEGHASHRHNGRHHHHHD